MKITLSNGDIFENISKIYYNKYDEILDMFYIEPKTKIEYKVNIEDVVMIEE